MQFSNHLSGCISTCFNKNPTGHFSDIDQRPTCNNTIKDNIKKPATAPIHPIEVKNRGAEYFFVSVCMVLIGLLRPSRPSMISDIITGIPIIKIQSKYAKTNAEPPYSPVI